MRKKGQFRSGGTVIKTFSYGLDDISQIETARRLAEADNKTFSDLMMFLIKEYVKKNEEALNNPLNLCYGTDGNKSLDDYIYQTNEFYQFIEKEHTQLSANDMERVYINADRLVAISKKHRSQKQFEQQIKRKQQTKLSRYGS